MRTILTKQKLSGPVSTPHGPAAFTPLVVDGEVQFAATVEDETAGFLLKIPGYKLAPGQAEPDTAANRAIAKEKRADVLEDENARLKAEIEALKAAQAKTGTKAEKAAAAKAETKATAAKADETGETGGQGATETTEAK